MVLQGAKVVHLGAVGVVERNLLRGAPLALQAGVGAHPGVVAAECNRGEQGGAVAVAGGLLMTELPHVRAQQVEPQIAHPCRLLGVQDQPRHHQGTCLGRGLEPLDDGELAVGASVHHQPRVERHPVAAHVVGDHDRFGDDPAGRHGDGHREVVSRVELVEDVVDGDPVDQLAHGLVVDSEPLGTDDGGARGGGHGRRHELGKVELTDSAVAPHLLLGGGDVHRHRPLGGGNSERPVGCGGVDGIDRR